MPLSKGEKLGPYEIVSAIGAGGMGEVYKVRDTRLNRTIAIKILPEHIANRDDLRARFEREARAVASLNHPNICTLHDIGSQDGAGYMVMEYMEGETLAARIAEGALPLDEALKFATQIADALDRAHRAGVTHRDVKPQNIMLTRDGVKLLDFGLAKSTTKTGLAEETLSAALTTEGTVLGTPQYMAPEQFAGQEADARSDIFAFGAVLYEMVTGRKAFQGKSYSSLVGAILAADPAPISVKPFTPMWLERLVRRCLAKDPEDRWQTMRDVVIELRTPPRETAFVAPARAIRWPWAVAVAAALVLGPLIGWLQSRSRQSPALEQVHRFQLNAPEGGRFETTRGLALSPDGRSLAFFASAPGKSGLWVRPLNATTARLLPGTEAGSRPFWSPDSSSIAFWASNKLWRVDVSGGAPSAVFDATLLKGTEFRGGDWAPDGSIVFGTQASGLYRVPSSGGIPQPLTTPDASRGATGHRYPQLLPGGKVLFLVVGEPERAGIYATSLGNPRHQVRLVATKGMGVFAAGHLLWLRGSTLVAQPFDPERLQLSGDPKPIADPVGESLAFGIAAAASATLLVHDLGGNAQFTWVDRSGQAARATSRTFGQPGRYTGFRISPDGRRVAVGRDSAGGRDLWLVDVDRDAWSRFTFLTRVASFPVWSPDGSQVMFQSAPQLHLYRKEASGAGTEQRVAESESPQAPNDWSRDGRLVLYGEAAANTQRDLWVLPVTPDGKPQAGTQARPYLRTPFDEYSGRFSPEPSPRWVAYESNESGRPEVYIQAFPEPRGKFQISTGGGEFPEWSADGRELYYVAPDRKLMAVSVQFGADRLTPSTPRPLFTLPPDGGAAITAYAPAPDGQRFLVRELAGGSQPLEVVVNWPGLLKPAAPRE